MKKRIVLSLLFFVPFLFTMNRDVPVSVKTCAFTTKGKRKINEDRYVVTEIECNNKKYQCTAIFDGHGASAGKKDNNLEVAQLAQDNFFVFFKDGLEQKKSIQDSFGYAVAQCEERAKEEKYSNTGTTVSASCFDPDTNQLHFCSLGDSKALVLNCYKTWIKDSLVTVEHNCTNDGERQRVLKAGGKIRAGKLNGIIEVTRSLGDAFAKTKIPQLIAEPVFVTRDVCQQHEGEDPLKQRVHSIEASDGFWNALRCEGKSSQKVLNHIFNAVSYGHINFYDCYSEGDEGLMSDSEDDHEVNIAQRLCYIVSSKSTDNITVIVQSFARTFSSHIEDYLLFSHESDSNDSNENSDSFSYEDYDGESGNDSGEGDSGTSSESETGIDLSVLDKSLAALSAFKPGAEKNIQNGDGGTALPEQEQQKEQFQKAQQPSDQKITINEEEKNKDFKDTGWQKYGNYALMVGGGLGLLAIIYALFHYNYNPLNFVLG